MKTHRDIISVHLSFSCSLTHAEHALMMEKEARWWGDQWTLSKRGSASERNQKMPKVVHTFWPGNYPWCSTGRYSTREGIWWRACVHSVSIRTGRTEVRPAVGGTAQQVASSLRLVVTPSTSSSLSTPNVFLSHIQYCALYNIHSPKDRLPEGLWPIRVAGEALPGREEFTDQECSLWVKAWSQSQLAIS